ncbi:hypothetical protein [Lysinibacter cavernae]|uniref:Uncharacterized protein n=1 Tax=Lysinibacter cavernae TaxID=1640652 RepID=A0A7X5TUL3_9MICO|nr:hypothetical protein [Lysinibacter cavernae]NIH54503.1 hypothetical protein [Lysinibacter cavernae]
MISLRRLTATTAIALIAVAPLAACASPVDMVKDQANQAADKLAKDVLGEDSSVDLDLDGDGATLPAEWPAEVPAPPGRYTLAATTQGNPSVTATDLTIAEVDAYVTTLTDAGFSSTVSTSTENSFLHTLSQGGMTLTIVGGKAEAIFTLQLAAQ